MSDTDSPIETNRTDERTHPAISDAVRSTESYETEKGVVFYDAENPPAWLHTAGCRSVNIDSRESPGNDLERLLLDTPLSSSYSRQYQADHVAEFDSAA